MKQGITRRASLASLIATSAAVIPANVKGAGHADYSVGLLSTAHLAKIPPDVDLICITGITAVGDAGAGQIFSYDPAIDPAHVSANPGTAFVDAGGRGFRRIVQPDAADLRQDVYSETNRASIDPRTEGAAYINKTPVHEFFTSPPDLSSLPDSQAALQAAMNAAASETREGAREVVIRGAGYVGLKGGHLEIPRRGIRLISDGDARFIRQHADATALFSYRPSDPSTYYPLTANAFQHAERVTVGARNAAAFAINQYAFIRAHTLLPTPITNLQGDKIGQVVKIIHIDAGVLYFDRCLFYDFTMDGGAEIAPLPEMALPSHFENIRWGEEQSAVPAGRMFDLRWTTGYRLLGIECQGQREFQDGSRGESSSRSVVQAANSVDLIIDGFEFANGAYYGISPQEASANWVIRNGRAVRQRHTISGLYSGSGSGYGEPANILIENVESHFSGLSGIDCHDTGFGWTIRKCRSVGAQRDAGIQIRCRDALIEDCYVAGNRTDGIVFRNNGVNGTMRDIKAVDNGRFGINGAVGEIIVEDSLVKGNAVGGIDIESGKLRNVRFEENGTQAIRYAAAATVNDPRLYVENCYHRNHGGANFIVCGGSVDLNTITLVDNEIRGNVRAVTLPDATAATPLSIRERGTRWTADAKPNPARRGRATLAAGTVTINTAAVRSYPGGRNAPAFKSDIRLRFFTPSGTEERLWVSAIIDRTSFTIKSSDVASTREIVWEIE